MSRIASRSACRCGWWKLFLLCFFWRQCVQRRTFSLMLVHTCMLPMQRVNICAFNFFTLPIFVSQAFYICSTFHLDVFSRKEVQLAKLNIGLKYKSWRSKTLNLALWNAFSSTKTVWFLKGRKQSVVRGSLLFTKLFSFQSPEVCPAGMTVGQHSSSYSRCPTHDSSAISKPLTKN